MKAVYWIIRMFSNSKQYLTNWIQKLEYAKYIDTQNTCKNCNNIMWIKFDQISVSYILKIQIFCDLFVILFTGNYLYISFWIDDKKNCEPIEFFSKNPSIISLFWLSIVIFCLCSIGRLQRTESAPLKSAIFQWSVKTSTQANES